MRAAACTGRAGLRPRGLRAPSQGASALGWEGAPSRMEREGIPGGGYLGEDTWWGGDLGRGFLVGGNRGGPLADDTGP